MTGETRTPVITIRCSSGRLATIRSIPLACSKPFSVPIRSQIGNRRRPAYPTVWQGFQPTIGGRFVRLQPASSASASRFIPSAVDTRAV